MIRGKRREIPPQDNKQIRASIHNEFVLEVLDSVTGKTKKTAKAYNVICNQWWTRQFSTSGYPVSYIHYGTGSGTPSSSDTSLFSYLGGKSVDDDSWGGDPDAGVVWKRVRIQLSETEIVGSELTEVGIAYGSAAASLCTHAMLQDMNGNPVSIVKSSTDIINIYATVFAHWDVANLHSKGIALNPSSSLALYLCGRSYIYQMLNRMYIKSEVGRSAYVTHSNTAAAKRISGSYAFDADNKKLTMTYKRLAAGSYNLDGGIAAIGFGAGDNNETSILLFVENGVSEQMPTYEVLGEAVATGDGSTTDYQTKFPLVQSAIVYVDGVECADVTVDLNKPVTAYATFGLHMHAITERGNPFYENAPNYSSYHISGNSYGYSYYYDTNPHYFENPFWETVGIASIDARGATVELAVSNDLLEWTVVDSPGSWTTCQIPESYRKYRYWRFTGDKSSGWSVIIKADISDTKNIHFSAPPAEGSVITVDYRTKTIPKDTNHVFDMKLSLQLNEYTEAQ